VHGQGADVAAGEEDGVHGEGVGADGHGTGHFQEGRVVQAVQHRVAQIFEEQLADEPMRSLAAAAVIKKNPVHAFPLSCKLKK
jgi:hypothetical protein